MDALYFFSLHTSHTLPTASCKKEYRCYLCSFTCTHCTHRTLYPHQSKPPTMTGIYVSIIFTCTHRTHRTLYPQLLERKNMDDLYFSGLHTLHTLPTASCKKKYGCSLFFWPAHIAHTTHSILQEKIWMLPIIFTCTHCTHRTLYPQLLERKNMDALYFFRLHTLHTPHTPHQTKPPTMTGIHVSIIFTCTHRTHSTLYPHLIERKNMDALYFLTCTHRETHIYIYIYIYRHIH